MPRFVKQFLSPFDLPLVYSTFLFLLSLWFIPKNSCTLRLTEVNLTEVRLTVSWTEWLLRYFYRIFTLTIAVLPWFKRKRIKTFFGICPLIPTGGLTALPRPPAATLCAFGTCVFCFARKRWAHIFYLYYPLPACQTLPKALDISSATAFEKFIFIS